MTITWVVPGDADVRHVAQEMRAKDAEECFLASGLGPLEALQRGIAVSTVAFCALADGVPVVIFGGRNGDLRDPETGVAWALGTTWVDAHKIAFARASKCGLRMLWDSLDVKRMENLVWVGHEESMHWLYWLGAYFGRIPVAGANGGWFIRFTLEREA